MKFASPIYLLIGAITVIALIILRAWLTRRSQRDLSQFAASRLIPQLTKGLSTPRRRLKATLFILATALLFLALARPQWGSRREEVRLQGIDILIALDTSRSMLASDITPNRLDRAKLAIHDFTTTMKTARIGLLPFAGDAFLICPLTLDRTAFETTLDELDTRIIPEGGTDIARAIREASKVLNKGANQKILILITDGEDLEGGAIEAAKEAKEKGITIHTVGVGTPSGNLIMLENGRPLTDANGKAVRSKLDSKTLQKIASITGGMYAPLVGSISGLELIRRQALAQVSKSELESQTREIPIERYQWPLGAALLLLALEFCIGTAKKNRKLPSTATAVALTLLSLTPYLQAEEASTTPDPRRTYNQGTELWKEGKFSESEQHFKDSLNAADLSLQNRAYYNLGNTRYRLGQASQQKAPQKTIQLWEQAIKAYEAALKLNPNDEDAAYNKKLVEKKLKELKKKQQQQKKKKDNKKKDQKKQQKKDQNKKDQKKQKKQQNQDKQQKKDDQKSENNKKKDQNKDQQNQEKDKQAKDKNKDQKNKDQKNKSSKPNKKDEESKGGKDKKDQKKPDKKLGDKDQNQQPNKPKKQDAKSSDKPKPDPEKKAPKGDEKKAPSQPQRPQKGDHNQKAQPQSAQPTQRIPGQMSKEEAKRLLESLKNEEGKVRYALPLRPGKNGYPRRPRRDW